MFKFNFTDIGVEDENAVNNSFNSVPESLFGGEPQDAQTSDSKVEKPVRELSLDELVCMRHISPSFFRAYKALSFGGKVDSISSSGTLIFVVTRAVVRSIRTNAPYYPPAGPLRRTVSAYISI